MTVKIGDSVRFLNSTGGGKVVKIDGGIAQVEDADGFLTPVLVKEIVVVGNATDDRKKVENTEEASTHIAASTTAFSTAPQQAPEPEQLEEYVETPEAEKLNLMLAFLPTDLKNPDQNRWEIYMVNDCNFWLFLNILTRSAEDDRWTLRSSKTIEPGTQVFIEEIEASDINGFEHVRVQYLAYKPDKPFTAKTPGDIEEKIDITKFFKLHCYQPNAYFEEDVLSFMLVTNDKAAGHKKSGVDQDRLREAMMQKRRVDMEHRRSTFKRKPPKPHNPLEPLVVDLHIEELVENTKGMSPADMLNRQIDEFRSIMDEHKNQKGKKIIFIHGKGEGVLRKALLKELNHLYKGHDVQDASFKEYGFGATQVTIR